MTTTEVTSLRAEGGPSAAGSVRSGVRVRSGAGRRKPKQESKTRQGGWHRTRKLPRGRGHQRQSEKAARPKGERSCESYLYIYITVRVNIPGNMKHSHDSIENGRVNEKACLEMVRGTGRFPKGDAQAASGDVRRSWPPLIRNGPAGALANSVAGTRDVFTFTLSVHHCLLPNWAANTRLTAIRLT